MPLDLGFYTEDKGWSLICEHKKLLREWHHRCEMLVNYTNFELHCFYLLEESQKLNEWDKSGITKVRVRLIKAFSIILCCFPRSNSLSSVPILLYHYRSINTLWISFLLVSMMLPVPNDLLLTDFVFLLLLILLVSLIRLHNLILQKYR